jgi:rRNA biogenesis protein RRP5
MNRWSVRGLLASTFGPESIQFVNTRIPKIVFALSANKSAKQKAEALFETVVKKFGSKNPSVWENYADFLHKTANAPERARALLKRATQALDDRHYLPLMVKFAALEFHSPNGDAEQGRTLFEGLLAGYPKRFDLWNQLLDLESSAHSAAKAAGGSAADPAVVRDVFERGAKVKGLKAEKAKKWFKRWAQWEEQNGDAKSRERVSARAQQWAKDAEARKKSREEADE